MRSYFVVCALFIASFALATSGCGSSRGTTDARDGAGDGQGDSSVDRADVGTGKGGTGGSVGGNGGSAGGGSSGSGGSAGGGSGGSAGDAGGTSGSGGSGGTTDGGMNNDGGPDGATPTCNDGIKNSDETGIDCGGHCGKCGPDSPCLVNADCTFACRADKTCAACNLAADCSGTESECQHRTCTAGVCGSVKDPAGTVLTVQTIGDCKKRQCAADGTVATVNDDTDVPNDQNACTNDICTSGVSSHTTLPNGSNCGGANHCQSGACIGCTVASDCPGADTACSTRTCSAAGVCGHSFKDAGYKLVDPTAGDCKGLQCDGQGNAQVFTDNADLPVDTNPCTTDECSSGTPSHRPAASGTNCGGSLVCDGASNCVECLSANSCPGSDTECRMRSCILGQCGVTNAAAGTLTAAQTAGDCKKNVCSGGAPVVVNDDLDLPVDNNPCTMDVCTTGMPSNPFVAAGSACGASTICDGQGACVSCLSPSSCPGTDTECHHRTCTNGACGVINTAAGTALTTQTAGDCKVVQCDGSGDVRMVNDDTDKPVDGKACTDDLCNGGVPSNPNLSSGTACGNGLMCDGQGACVGCVTAANCGNDTPCQTHTCTNGACGVNNAAAGTALPTASQTAGDCKKVQCDGMGQTQTVNDDTDLPVDGNACTKDLCAAGQPSNPAESAGTACGMGGGTKCNGSPTAPACVQCLQASECPGSDTDCHHRTCTSGVCGIANAAEGFVVPNQTAGNCKKDVCMGGAQVTINDDTDLPVDGNGCTMDLCMNGMPSNPSLPANATCNENGGTRCNGSPTAPACVQCIVNGDCGPNSECQLHSCSATGTCVTTNVANGTALVMQTAGDCQKGVCNGTGGTAFAIDNTDVPVDGKTCTDDVCTGGVPSNPPRTAGTACNQSGGVQCNATGSCVQCLQPSDCGTDTACRTFTCSAAGACGSTPAADGKFVTNAPAGNCHKDVCMSGDILHVVDDGDVPVDGNLCTDDVCANGAPSNPNVATGVSCGDNLMCNGLGSCVGCITEANCGPPPNACQVAVCMNGMCGFTNVANGTVLATQTAGDCHKDVCMNGSVVSMVDDNDVLVDGNPCTQDLCSGGNRSNPPFGAGVACSVGSGTMCDGAGSCVECLDASTCPGGPDNAPCHVRTCNAGVCGISEPPDGTSVSGGVSGDCQRNVCDGAGNVKSIADDTDVLAPTTLCATPMCSGGVPMSTNSAHGTACVDSGGRTCDGVGACILTFDVVRVGAGGATALSNIATLTFIEEHMVSTGAAVGSPLQLPSAESGTNHAFSLTGSGSGSTSEGELQLSVNGKYVVLAGYNRVPGLTGNLPNMASSAVNRMVARIDGAGTMDTSTLFGGTAFTANNVRGVTTIDGTTFWGSGAGGTAAGIWFTSLGATSTSMPTQVFSTATRWVGLFPSASLPIQLQLYGTGSNSPLTNVWTVGSGVPTTTGQTAATLTGMPNTLSPHGFVLFDKNGDGLVETLYVADDSTVANGGGIQRWTFSSTTSSWSHMTTETFVDPAGTGGFRGLLGTMSGTDVILVAVTSDAVANRIVKFVDSGPIAAGTVISTAAANTVYRGVALAPQR